MSAFRFARTGVIAAALSLSLTACDGDAEEADEGAIMGGGAEVESDFDASTVDVMSVDTAAGGIEPPMDPSTADAGLDMLGNNMPETSEEEASVDDAN